MIIYFSYSYGILRKTKTGNKWRCTQRNPSQLCGAMVNQLGNSFTRTSREHCHPPTTGKATKVKAVRAVKETAKTNPYQSAYTIAENVLLSINLTMLTNNIK